MLSALPGRNDAPDDVNEDKVHRRMGRFSTQVTDIHLPRKFQVLPNQELVLVTAKRKYLIAKSRFKDGYIERFGVVGAIAGGLAVFLTYLCWPLFRVHLFLDVPSAIFVGIIIGCMSGSLLGSVFAMATSQFAADSDFTTIPAAPAASERIANAELNAGARVIPLTATTTQVERKSDRCT